MFFSRGISKGSLAFAPPSLPLACNPRTELTASARQFCETSRVDLTPGQAASAVERHPCPKCDAPAGSPCRTGGGKTAARYHTARFILVPALREELNVAVAPDRSPG